ncbi:MAG TPA: NAD(P)/FAD-dependent oxidoreductase [Myxococcota bacterium]|nr:NAD(P)/FAD-dependent oxidoreductase [Myxococcota bacterium]
MSAPASAVPAILDLRRPIRTVAILGGGPAGASLALRLARAGLTVGLYDRGNRPPLIVGESLVPAIIPFLQELGLEEEVRGWSTYKPGATFVLAGGSRVRTLKFAQIADTRLTYAWNVPRDKLDAAMTAAAVRAGARLIPAQAKVERVGEDRLRLSEATLAAADGLFGPDGPDHIVDATGRARAVAKLLDLPYAEGPRKDTALFAHLEGVPVIDEGHVHTDVLDAGWAWRIPLPGRVSVGFVVPQGVLAARGEGAEAQYDATLRTDSVVQQWGATPRRVSPVLRYNNYQLVSARGSGENWSLVGDAFGFVDPVFSSGMLIGLASAATLADAILGGGAAPFHGYETEVQHHLRAWQRAVGHFYNGRLFTTLDLGEDLERSFPGSLFAPHFRRHIPRVFTGESTRSRYSLGLLDVMCRFAIARRDPSRYAVSG